jgi:hypothetical protein
MVCMNQRGAYLPMLSIAMSIPGYRAPFETKNGP